MTTVHPTAVIGGGAQLGEGVDVGPYCVVGPDVRLGAGTRLLSHVVVDGHTTLGAGCTVFPFACLGTLTQDRKYAGGTTRVEIGDATTIREYVTVNSGTQDGEVTRVGSKCLLLAYCHVAHGCSVGNEVTMANGASLSGEVVVEDMVTIGGMTGVHQFVRIGRLCMVGGMSRITQDCPPFMIVEGHEARVHAPNSVGLERRGVDPKTRKLIKDAYKILYREELATRQAVEKIRAQLELVPEIEHLLAFIEKSTRGIVK